MNNVSYMSSAGNSYLDAWPISGGSQLTYPVALYLKANDTFGLRAAVNATMIYQDFSAHYVGNNVTGFSVSYPQVATAVRTGKNILESGILRKNEVLPGRRLLREELHCPSHRRLRGMLGTALVDGCGCGWCVWGGGRTITTLSTG